MCESTEYIQFYSLPRSNITITPCHYQHRPLFPKRAANQGTKISYSCVCYGSQPRVQLDGGYSWPQDVQINFCCETTFVNKILVIIITWPSIAQESLKLVEFQGFCAMQQFTANALFWAKPNQIQFSQYGLALVSSLLQDQLGCTIL